MKHQRWLIPVLLSLFVPNAQAQPRSGMSGSAAGNVHVHVILDNDRAASASLLVTLMGSSNSAPIGTAYTNDAGKADFWAVPVGEYHVVVTGEGIQTADSGSFELDERKVAQALYITVRRVDDSGSKTMGSKSATVSAVDLNAPPKARKELEKATDAMAHQQWSKAVELLNKAISIYPQYVGAYNNLGVVYSRMNDPVHEQEALEKAITLDDHFAPACENLAKLYLRQKDFSHAETLLGKALSVDPNNGQSLTLLADTQYMERHYDAAIATAQKVHALPSQHPSTIHYIAAMAYQQESRQREALAEFQMFLKEEPTGQRADRVRSDMAKMQASAQ